MSIHSGPTPLPRHAPESPVPDPTTVLVGDEPAPPMVYTPAEAAERLRVPESWLRRKAGARQVPCTLLGRHLRFSAADLDSIVTDHTQPAAGRPAPERRRR